MALDVSPRDEEIIDNEVGIGVPQSTPMPAGAAAATMPTMTPQGAPPPGGAPMDSLITDFLISKFGGRGVQGANAAPAPPSPPAVGAPSSPVTREALGPLHPMPQPRPSGAPISMPPPTTGSANASAPPPQIPPELLKRGALQQYLPAVVNAFLPAPAEGAVAPPPRSGAGSASAVPVAPPPPSAAGGGSAPAGTSWMDIVRGALKYSVGPSGRSDYNVSALGPTPDIPPKGGSGPASGRGSANAAPGGSTTYPPKDTGATGDEFAARRQGQKIGPPQLESLPKGASSRYTKPYARGGVKEGEKRPQQSKPRASAGRSSSGLQTRKASASPRAGQAPQTARGGRSAYAQSLIDSMGPRGAGVTTYIEPATGNEILTGNGMYMNLGKTSTGTSKPAFTKFFS